MNPTMLSRVQGCLMGVAIGDAMGMPWEIMTPEEIYAATEGRGVTGFSDPVQRNIKGTMTLKAGDTTDDWQLTRAVAQSLVACGKFQSSHVARKHIAALELSHFGWGRTTQDSILAIKRWFETDGKEGRNPNILHNHPRPKEGQGVGNGIAMKVAPVALYHAIRFWRDKEKDKRLLYKLWSDVVKLGTMTHDDGRASVGAYAIADVIVRSMMKPHYTPPTGQDLRKYLDQFDVDVRERELWPFPVMPWIDKFSTKLIPLTLPDCLESAKQLRETTGTSCFTLESVPFSIGTFLRHPMDFRAGVLEAVNAGGDTDSNASMVGAMIGANVGIEEIPEEWKNFRPEFQEAITLGEQLFTTAFQSQ